MPEQKDLLESILEPKLPSQIMTFIDILWDAYKRIIVVAVTVFIICFSLLGGECSFHINWSNSKLIPKIIHTILK